MIDHKLLGDNLEIEMGQSNHAFQDSPVASIGLLIRRLIVLLLVAYGEFILPWLGRAASPPDSLLLGASSYRIVYRANVLRAVPLGRQPLLEAPSAAGAQPSPHNFDQVSVAAFDAINNALRVNASVTSGGVHTPNDADQVFTSIFDPATSAVRVNCVLGCGGGSGFTAAGDLSGSGTSQTVIGLQGKPVSTTAPAGGQVLTWNGTTWTPATGGAQIAGDLGGSLAAPKVVGLEGVAVSATAPTSGQCLVDASTGWAPGSCGTATGALVLAPAASQTIQPTSGSNVTPLALAPASGTTQTADLFDLWKDSGMTTKAFWIDASGNLNFLGNNATYGASGQATQSFLRMYGSTAASSLAPPYLDLEKVDGSVKSYLAPSTSVNGLVCVATAVPGGDCAPGTTLAPNPMTAAGDLVVGGTPNGLGIAPPVRLGLGASGQCLTSNGTTAVWEACGSGSFTAGGDLSGSASSQNVIGMHFGATGIALASTAPTSGQCLEYNGTSVVGASCGAGGPTSWSSLAAPTANLILSHGTNLTTFTFGALAGSPASDQFLIQDTTANTSTGSIVHILNVGTSTARPLTVESQNTAVTPLRVQAANGDTADLLDTYIGTTKEFYVNSAGAVFAHAQVYSAGDIGPSSGTTSASLGGVSGTSTSGAAGNITVKGTDDSGIGTAGNLEVVAGSATGTGTNGQLQIVQPFVKGATYTVGNLECLSADNTVADCTTTGSSEENVVGAALAAAGNAAQVLIRGEATVNFDASSTAAAGAYACLSGTTAAKVTITSTACTAGQAVGVLIKGVSATTSGTILVSRW